MAQNTNTKIFQDFLFHNVEHKATLFVPTRTLSLEPVRARGALLYNDETAFLCYSNGTSWVCLLSDAAACSQLGMTAGSLLSYDGTDCVIVDAGSPGDVLAIAGGTPAWQNACQALGMTAPGDLLSFDGTNCITIGIGDALDVLTVANGVPTWVSAVQAQMVTAIELCQLLGFTNVGDLLTFDGTDCVVFSAGLTDNILTVVGGTPTWQDACAALGMAAPGDLLTTDGTACLVISAGSPTDVLSVAGGVPAWQDACAALGMTAPGDLASFDGTACLVVGIGSANDVLSVVGGAPSWQGSAAMSATYVRTVVTVGDSPYAVLETDDFLAVDASGGPVTLTLPVITTLTGNKKRYVITDEAGTAGTNNIVVKPGGANFILSETAASGGFIMGTDWESITVYSDETSRWLLT